MATTRVPAYWVERRQLAPRCARHDVPSTHLDKREFYTRTPPWVILTFFIGILLFVILAMALRTTVKGALPACAQCTRDRRRFKLWAWGSWIGAGAVLAAAIGIGSDGLVLLGVLLLLAAIVVSCCGDRFRVSGFVTKDKSWVELKGVGPEFARIVEEAQRPQQQVAQAQATLPPMAAAYLTRDRSVPVESATAHTPAPTAPPQLSPDGHWWWDGTQWLPAAGAGFNQG